MRMAAPLMGHCRSPPPGAICKQAQAARHAHGPPSFITFFRLRHSRGPILGLDFTSFRSARPPAYLTLLKHLFRWLMGRLHLRQYFIDSLYRCRAAALAIYAQYRQYHWRQMMIDGSALSLTFFHFMLRAATRRLSRVKGDNKHSHVASIASMKRYIARHVAISGGFRASL